MIHSRWSGTHYEAGLSYGQALREQGIAPSAIPQISSRTAG